MRGSRDELLKRAVATSPSVTVETRSATSFAMGDLPIGRYQVPFSKAGFETALPEQTLVQGSRTNGSAASGNSQNFGVLEPAVGSNRFLQLSLHLTF